MLFFRGKTPTKLRLWKVLPACLLPFKLAKYRIFFQQKQLSTSRRASCFEGRHLPCEDSLAHQKLPLHRGGCMLQHTNFNQKNLNWIASVWAVSPILYSLDTWRFEKHINVIILKCWGFIKQYRNYRNVIEVEIMGGGEWFLTFTKLALPLPYSFTKQIVSWNWPSRIIIVPENDCGVIIMAPEGPWQKRKKERKHQGL